MRYLLILDRSVCAERLLPVLSTSWVAKQAYGLCEEAMRTYQSDKHPPSRQLFRCCE